MFTMTKVIQLCHTGPVLMLPSVVLRFTGLSCSQLICPPGTSSTTEAWSGSISPTSWGKLKR